MRHHYYSIHNYAEVMAFTEYIEEFDGGFLQPLTVKNSDEVDSSLHSLQEKVDSRIIGKQCLRLPQSGL